MIVTIDLGAEPPAVGLDEPDDCKRFHARAAGSAAGPEALARVGRALEGDGVGAAAEGEDVWIAAAAVRRLAAGRVAPDWEERFEAMLAFARSKGWIDESGQRIRAHVEWA